MFKYSRRVCWNQPWQTTEVEQIFFSFHVFLLCIHQAIVSSGRSRNYHNNTDNQKSRQISMRKIESALCPQCFRELNEVEFQGQGKKRASTRNLALFGFVESCMLICDPLWSGIVGSGTSVRHSSWPAFGRPTGNDVSGQWPLKTTLFSFLFSLSSTFLIEEVLVSKNLFRERWWERPKPRGTPCWPFWGPLAAILDFAGGVALQAVSECPRRR